MRGLNEERLDHRFLRRSVSRGWCEGIRFILRVSPRRDRHAIGIGFKDVLEEDAALLGFSSGRAAVLPLGSWELYRFFTFSLPDFDAAGKGSATTASGHSGI
jgi:hypothetical protein